MSEDAALRRSIGIVFSDGGLLALSAVRPAGAADHGAEEVVAILCDPDAAPVEVSEALLSTEYGPDGVQRRATLELWIGDDDAAAARRRQPDQLQRRAPSRARFERRLLPLVARGTRGPRPLRDRARRR